MFVGVTVLVLMSMEPAVSMKEELLRAFIITTVEHLTLSASLRRASIMQHQPQPIVVGLSCTGQNTKYRLTKHSPVGGMIRTFRVLCVKFVIVQSTS